MMKLNPYIAGNPVGGSEAFIGRADVLREVLRVLRNPHQNALVLFGQRRIGKTSVLLELMARLPNEGPYHPVFFDLQDKAAWPLGKVLQELAQTIAHSLTQPSPDLGSDPETTFCEIWLPTILNNLPSDSLLVLLFDEFDVLADPKGEQAAAAFFPYLRQLIASDPQRLDFVFVTGRNVADLIDIALSLFKGTPSLRVSLLNREDTIQLVRLTETNQTLCWPDETVERVYQLTNGHPFLTQQLCYLVWEQAYEVEQDEPPVVTVANVEAAVPGTLKTSESALEWLWKGLPPAERVVASALAAAGPQAISQEELNQHLRDSGVRILIGELQDAPSVLQQWDLIQPAEGDYRFRVELLRCWIAERKPLTRVQGDIDLIQPVAENLFLAAQGFYQRGNWKQAIERLREAISVNPNHLRANRLLAEILLAQGKLTEARQTLETLFQYQPAVAQPRLVQTILRQAQKAKTDEERLALYERALQLESTQPEATNGRRSIWQKRGDEALAADELEIALDAYQRARLTEKAVEVEAELRRRRLEVELQQVAEFERAGQYQNALELAQKLHQDFPEQTEKLPDLALLELKTQLDDLYQQALGALQVEDRPTAKKLLVKVVALEPTYQEATRFLHLAVTGVDVAELQAELESVKKTVKDVVHKEDKFQPQAKTGTPVQDKWPKVISRGKVR